MSVFCYKPIKKPLRLGDLLRTEREHRGWNIRSTALKSHIPTKYVDALEAGRFDELPRAKAHRIAYVRHYASILGLDTEACTTQFFHENGLQGVVEPTATKTHSKSSGRSISMMVRNGIVAGFIFLFIGYLIWQVKGIIEPPTLSVLSPIDGMVVSERSLLVQGEVKAGTRITINGQDVAGDGNGQFRVPIDLVEGLNTLTITATKKHGKTTQRLINVILKPALFNTP